MADAGTQTAIGASQHVLASDEIGIACQALGHEVRVLDEIGAMTDDGQGPAFAPSGSLEPDPKVCGRCVDMLADRRQLLTSSEWSLWLWSTDRR